MTVANPFTHACSTKRTTWTIFSFFLICGSGIAQPGSGTPTHRVCSIQCNGSTVHTKICGLNDFCCTYINCETGAYAIACCASHWNCKTETDENGVVSMTCNGTPPA
jgi:hypothetical protein